MFGDVDRLERPAWPSVRPPRVLHLLRTGFAAHGLVLLLAFSFALLFGCLALIMPELRGKVVLEAAFVIPRVIVPISALVLVTIIFIGMAVYERPARPTRRLLQHVLALARDPARWAAGIPAYLSLFVFMFAFGHFKASITAFQPFAWDVTLDRWDVALHFGRRPWEWLQPVFGHPALTLLLNLNYNGWFFVLMGFWAHYAVVVPPGVERTRFILAFMLTWIIGGCLCAILFSAAGPCFFGAGRLGITPDPYAGLMAYLNAASESYPIWALSVQSFLWHSLGQTTPFGGVSSMASMHNASALLFLLASRGFPRWVRLLLATHMVLIFIGSVHLAWHYAVDSYLAWAVVLAVWGPAARIARWWESRPQARAFSMALARR